MRTGNHKHRTKDEKLAILKRARQIILGGYSLEVVERRTHTNIRFLRQWAAEFEFQLERKSA